MSIETDLWPFVPALWFTKTDPGAKRAVRVVVVHTAEFPEMLKAARGIAQYFVNPRDAQGRPVKASAHVSIDHEEIIQSVRDNDVAYAAPGCNHDGIQIELAGRASQNAAQWDDTYSRAMLNLAANVCGQYCLKYSVPPVHLTNAQLLAGAKGVVGHDQVSAVYKRSTHTDPGSAFNWPAFVESVQAYHAARRLQVSP